MNLQDLPPEIIHYIYLFLGRKDKTALLLTSRYLFDYHPTCAHIHRIKFKQCLEKIRSILYIINTCDLGVIGENIGNSLIYRSGGKISRVILAECSFRWFENYAASIICCSHTCLRPDDILIADAIIIHSFAEKKNGKIIKIMDKKDNPVISRKFYNRRVIKLTED